MREHPSKQGNMYYEDYESIAAIKSIADKHSVGVILVTHLRKAGSEDPFERISGSTGVTGAADTMMVLVRERSQADNSQTGNVPLHVTGRDMEEQRWAMEFQAGTWKIIGTASEVFISNVRQ